MTQTIGRYEIRRELGRGAQSVVFLAWDPWLLREVAIKTLHFLHSDVALNHLLLTESRLVSQLHHANVVPIFDAGEQDGDPYLVFELVEGRTLSQMLRNGGPLTPVLAAELMRKVLDALSHAHGLGIIHRDLKPANILVDESGEPRLMDFGNATYINGSMFEAGKDIIGTPAYMAPEYVERREVSAKVDIYAAGLVLNEVLSGVRTFQSDGMPQLGNRILNQPVVLPRGVDRQLANTIRKACAKEPHLRFADAAQMRDALDEFISTASRTLPKRQRIARLWSGFGAARGLLPRYGKVGMEH